MSSPNKSLCEYAKSQADACARDIREVLAQYMATLSSDDGGASFWVDVRAQAGKEFCQRASMVYDDAEHS